MIKKLAIAAASAALVLGTVVPAFAETSVSNEGVVVNAVFTTANTGSNKITGGEFFDEGFVNGGSIHTGDATSVSKVENVLNTNTVDSTSFFGNEVNVQNGGLVLNFVETSSSTGNNTVSAGEVDGGSVTTGNAGAGSAVTNVVNTNVVSTTDLGDSAK